MTSWYRLDLGNGADAFAPTQRIQRAFTAMLIASGAVHPEWALFSRYDQKADNVELYFTPALRDLASQFSAAPCDKPTINEYSMGLLCGEGDALRSHFPDERIDHG